MSKSLYSLVLMDDLVHRVDQLASENGVSRSVMINRILAQHLSVQTPEMRMEEIFRRIVGANEHGPLQISMPGAGSMLQARRVLRYKYNPTIRYSIELAPGEEGRVGALRVSTRTQSLALMEELDLFFQLWHQMEGYCMRQQNLPLPASEYGQGRYRRAFRLRRGDADDPQELGQVIGNYIQMLDRALNRYISQGQERSFQPITEAYLQYLQESPIIL